MNKKLAIPLLSLTASLLPGLAPGQQVEDEVVVVTATRSEQSLEQVPAAIAVQDMARLRSAGFSVGTDEYRGVTGVFFRRGEGDADEFPFLSIRGSTGTEGSLSLIDGVPIVGLYEETQLNEIPYEAVERIEIVKGPVSALYGRGALYGATNYITRTPERDETRAALTLGSEDLARAELSTSRQLGRGGLLLSGSYEDNEGWREQSRRRIANLFGKLTVKLDEDSTFSSLLNVNRRRSELANGIPLDADGAPLSVAGGRDAFLGYGDPTNATDNAMLAATYERRLSPGSVLSLKGHARHIERDVFLNFFDPFGVDLSRNVIGYNGFRGGTRQSVGFLEATLRHEAGRHTLLAGVSAERSRIHEDIRWSGQNGFTPECGFTFYLVEVDYTTGAVLNRDQPCFAIDSPQTRDRFTNGFWGAFLQDEIALGEKTRLTLGGRYDRFRRRADFEPIAGVTDGGALAGDADAFSPKVTLSYLPSWGQAYLAYGRGFNSNFGATFEWDPVQYARPDSRPTTIDSFELGMKGHALEERLRFEAAVYFTRQKNRRQIIANPDAETDFTAPGSLISFGDLYEGRGAELSLRYSPSAGTRFTANYSRIDPRWKDYVIETFSGPVDLSGNTPTGVPRNTAYFAWEQRLAPWFQARASFEIYDDYYYTVDNQFSGGGHELLTLGARVQPESWRQSSLDVTLLNALDREYFSYFGTRNAPTYAVPGIPRELRLTFQTRF